jgi:hypothetical protein
MTLRLREIVHKNFTVDPNFSFYQVLNGGVKRYGKVSESVYRTANGVSLRRLLSALNAAPPIDPGTVQIPVDK